MLLFSSPCHGNTFKVKTGVRGGSDIGGGLREDGEVQRTEGVC